MELIIFMVQFCTILTTGSQEDISSCPLVWVEYSNIRNEVRTSDNKITQLIKGAHKNAVNSCTFEFRINLWEY